MRYYIFQAYGDYVKVILKDKTLLTKDRLSSIEERIPKTHFQKIHRSYIIALPAIEFIEGNQVQINGVKLPIATTYVDKLMLRLKKVDTCSIFAEVVEITLYSFWHYV